MDLKRPDDSRALCHCGRRTWNGTDKRKNLFLTAKGETLRLSEWAKKSGLSAQVIHHRLKVGWTEEQAVMTPAGKGKGTDNAINS